MNGLQIQPRNTTFKDIDGFPGYCVGDDGSVWSRKCGRWRKLTPARSKSREGYLFVGLRKEGKTHHRSIHALVLTAFVGPAPPGMECCHGPGGMLDNRLSNLRWGTREENARDKFVAGTVARGERHGRAKLSAAQVATIRERVALGENIPSIANDFPVSYSTVMRVARGELWKDQPAQGGTGQVGTLQANAR